MAVVYKPGEGCDSLPGYIKVDFDSDLETLFNYLIGCSGVVTGLIFIDLLSGGGGKGFAHNAWNFLMMAVLTGLFGFIRFHIDNYYVLSPKERAIFYRFRFFGYERRDRLYSFDEIRFVTTRGNSSKSGWTYTTVVFDVRGGQMDFGKATGNFAAADIEARNLAGVIGCDHLESRPEHLLLVDRTGGKLRAEHVAKAEFFARSRAAAPADGSSVFTVLKFCCALYGIAMLIGLTSALLGR